LVFVDALVISIGTPVLVRYLSIFQKARFLCSILFSHCAALQRASALNASAAILLGDADEAASSVVAQSTSSSQTLAAPANDSSVSVSPPARELFDALHEQKLQPSLASPASTPAAQRLTSYLSGASRSGIESVPELAPSAPAPAIVNLLSAFALKDLRARTQTPRLAWSDLPSVLRAL
jgi:hypothetical protein